MEIQYRLLDPGSDIEIRQWLDLYQICFQDTMSRDYWHWLFETNPFYLQTKPLIFIAEMNGKIIGSRSVIPYQFQVNMHQDHYFLNLGYLYGAMVHPEQRNRGIASTLLKNIINLTKAEGYDLLTSFTVNLYAYKSLLRAGFTCINSTKKSTGYLSFNGLLKNCLPVIPQSISRTVGFPISKIFTQLFPKLSHTYQVRYGDLSDYFEEITKICALNHSDSGIYGARTPPNLLWRFSAPGILSKCLSLWEEKTMVAYLILDYPDDGKNVLIEDMFARGDNEYLKSILVSEAVAMLKKHNIDSIWTYLIDGKKNHSQIFSVRQGFISCSFIKTFPIARFLYFPLKENQNNMIFSDKEQWKLWCADFWYFEPCDY